MPFDDDWEETWGLEKGLVSIFCSEVWEFFGGDKKVLFTSSESVSSAAKLPQINLQKVGFKTLACGKEKHWSSLWVSNPTSTHLQTSEAF